MSADAIAQGTAGQAQGQRPRVFGKVVKGMDVVDKMAEHRWLGYLAPRKH